MIFIRSQHPLKAFGNDFSNPDSHMETNLTFTGQLEILPFVMGLCRFLQTQPYFTGKKSFSNMARLQNWHM